MNVKGFMPHQGLLLIAALLPEEWKVRLVDESTFLIDREGQVAESFLHDASPDEISALLEVVAG